MPPCPKKARTSQNGEYLNGYPVNDRAGSKHAAGGAKDDSRDISEFEASIEEFEAAIGSATKAELRTTVRNMAKHMKTMAKQLRSDVETTAEAGPGCKMQQTSTAKNSATDKSAASMDEEKPPLGYTKEWRPQTTTYLHKTFKALLSEVQKQNADVRIDDVTQVLQIIHELGDVAEPNWREKWAEMKGTASAFIDEFKLKQHVNNEYEKRIELLTCAAEVFKTEDKPNSRANAKLRRMLLMHSK